MSWPPTRIVAGPGGLLTATRNPLVILLLVLAVISFATGDARAGTVMALDGGPRGVAALRAGDARGRRGGETEGHDQRDGGGGARGAGRRKFRSKQLVPGDVVKLSAGDMIPADVRLLAAKDLFISQGTLTGESLPVEKFATRETRTGIAPLEFANICFLGTSVESGAATAVILATGAQTYFGSMAESMTGEPEPTSFDKGMQQFTWLMIRFMMVMVPLVFLINGSDQAPLARSVLLLDRRRGGAHAGNAADDRLRLPVQRARSRCRGRRSS